MSVKKSILLRVRIASLGVAIFIFCIAAKIGYIQIEEGNKWKKMQTETMYAYKKVKATRGDILSDNGSLLATSLPFYKVCMDPSLAKPEVFKKGIDSLCILLANYFKDRSWLDYREMIKNARTSGKKYIILNRRQIDFEAKEKMNTWPIFREGKYKGGALFEKTEIRYRPFSNLSRRTIGFINENNKGAGLEYAFNKTLQGQDGEALFQRLVGGVWKPIFDERYIRAIDGNNIQTTLDIDLQDVAETALYNAMKQHDADEGTAVVMEVKTGYVKAISNLTANRFGDYEEKFNHAIGGSFEPGSTFKLATMIALLEGTNLSLTDSVNTGNGEYVVYNQKVRDHMEKGFGKITVQRAFEVSSNIAMAKLIDKYFGVRPSLFMQHMDDLRLTKPLGLQISGESQPKITRPTDKEWSGITLAWMAYGYGFELSPLHTLTLFNAVANGGKMIKPMFVKSILRANDEIEKFDTETLNEKICSDKTLLKLKVLLEGVVENGTANNLKNNYCPIAGKTGTAQILNEGKYESRYITSFVGYFPAHAPKYSAIVLIKNPKGIHQYGNSVAGPVFRIIADNIYARDLELHKYMEKMPPGGEKDLPVVMSGKKDELVMLANTLGISNHINDDAEWVKTRVKDQSIFWKENQILRQRVPDVVGMTFRDALYLLEKSGLRVSFQGEGRVVKQSIQPGSRVASGNLIYIELS